MSIRKIEITVQNITEPKSIERVWAGIQYEDNATEIVFDLSSLGITDALYRIDLNSVGAGYHPSESLKLTGGKIKRSIPKIITLYGGEAEAAAVITELDSAGKETGVVYSYPVTLYFTPIEKSEFGNETVEGNISAMEESVKKMTEITEKNTETAVNAAESALRSEKLTEEARFSLEHDSEFIFLGGDANSSTSVELVIDGEISDNSQNPVMNKVVKAYVDRTKDFIVEQSDDGGTWRWVKWQSGKAQCWGRLTSAMHFSSEGNSSAFGNATVPWKSLACNFPSGLFAAEPTVFTTACKAGAGVVTASNNGSTKSKCIIMLYGETTAMDSANVFALGYWK